MATTYPADLQERMAAVRAETARKLAEMTELRGRLAATLTELHQGRANRQPTHDQAFARLQARLETLPIIEQAKGIIMAQTGGDADHAFEVLRRASQRTNRKLRDLAAEIVRRAELGPENIQQGDRPPHPSPPVG